MTKFLLLLSLDSRCAFLEFADYLETSLLRDVARAAPYAVLARINTLIPGAAVTAAHIHDVPPSPPFHAAVEGWLPETADILRLHRDLDNAFEPGSPIDSHQTRLLAIESHATPGRDLPASIGAPDDGSMVKMLVKLQRRPGTTFSFFRDYYDIVFMDCPWYGSRQMARHLQRLGRAVGRRRVRRLMAKMGLAPIYQRPRTSDPHPEHRIYPYLLRNLEITRANHVWCADVTYLPMRKGFLYLVAIMDWASRKVRLPARL